LSKPPFDRILAVDFETSWGREVKLGFSCQTNEEYLRDPRFKAWGLSWKEVGTDNKAVWVRRNGIQDWANSIDWTRTALVCQNTQFDGSILSWHYGVQPCFMFDTLSMGRALHGVEVGNSLKVLAERYGLPPKGDGLSPSENILDELPFDVEQTLADYCKHDTWLCEQIFLRMLPGYPSKELRLIDLTLRMYTRPLLVLDGAMLEPAIEEERQAREELLTRLGVEETALASNDKFASVLEGMGVEPPTKVSKTTGEKTFAFAKNDALFQAMMNSDNEAVALLCEARLMVKSTLQRTRAQRFLDISRRGPLPFPVNYYGAATGRYTASKGSQINLQNLKRGSFLRKAITAPEGHVLVVGDLSQIEPRVLAWLSDYGTLLDIFKGGGDPYATFGSGMFNIPGMTKDSHPVERQSAKSALLGCFGGNTPVLTQRGWVIIQEVLPEDRVWDGTAWVTHQGVVPQGEKEVLTAHGISATSDHEILTEHGWAAWSAVLADPSLFQSAQSLANSLASVGSDARKAPSGAGALCTSPTCGAPAGGRASCTAPIFAAAEPRAVTRAQRKRPLLRAWRGADFYKFARTAHTATACSIASVRSLCVALIHKALRIQITAGAVSQYIRHGLQTALSSCAISLGWMAGTNRNFSLTGSTTVADMYPAICVLSHAASTWPTSGASLRGKSRRLSSALPVLKQRMQTYDIAYAGPRNRYTILTDAGPLIVHNCGYQLGWASFAAQLLTGFLGAPPKRYTKAEARQLGVTSRDVDIFIGTEHLVKTMEAIPHSCTAQELLIHCLAAQAIITRYRATAQPVVRLWELFQNLISYSLFKGNEYRHKCLTFRKEEIVLPNGMSLRYPDLKPEGDGRRIQWTYADGKKRSKLYAGKITNNVVQGTARIVMTDGMLRIDKRYPVAGTVHDEAIAIAPESEAEEAKKWVLAQMVIEPTYLPGIPLSASGGMHKRYGLAKD
jgi:hypothetical protein